MVKKEFIKESLHSLKEEGLLAMLKQTRSVITSYDRNGFDIEYIPNNGSGFVFLSNRIDNYKDVKDRYIQAFKIDCNDTEFIPKEFLTSRHWDNANSAKSGAGNILYIKNE